MQIIQRLIPALVCSFSLIPAGSAAAQTAAPAESGPTIRATVNEVDLDLVVRDKHGKLVKNLKPGDVQIYEDGVLQQIRSFRLAAGHPMEEPAIETKTSAPGGAAPALPLRKVNLVCIVFHNQNNLDVSMKKFTLEAVQEFLQSNWQPDTWVGVFSLGSRLSVLYPFTTNRNELLRAAGKGFSGGTFQLARVADAILNGTPNLDVVVGAVDLAARTGGATETLSTGTLNSSAILDVTQTTGLAQSAQRGDLVDQQREFGQIQGMQSIDQMKLMIGQLGQLPGHKTILMLSPGLPSNGDPELWEAVLSKARQVDISVYALDTNGLSENSNLLAANQGVQYAGSVSQQQGKVAMANGGQTLNSNTTGSVGQEAELMRQDDYVHTAVRGSDPQAPMRALSEGTGGFLIGGGNDLRKPFQHLMEDVGMHYEAVYRPVSDKYDGHLRKIEVKLAHADYSVVSRNGYFAMPDIRGSVTLMPFEVAGLTALNGQTLPHAFDFRTAAYQFRSESATNQIGVAFELPAANLTATPQPEQKNHRLHVSLMALVKDAAGQVVDKFSQDSPYEIPDDKLAAVQTLPITWTHPFDLPPGHYTVETAVLDREGNRVSTSVLPFDNPERRGLGLSSVMLVQQVTPVKGQADAADPFEFATSRVVPSLTSVLGKGAQPYVYFVVYPDKANTAKPKIGVQFLVDGKVLAQQTADLPAADATGAIPMVVSAVVKPGECDLKITALQGNALATQSVKYTVANQ
ncbi:MAG: VWA domain-containing protein [Bryobacteraceae bacterium]|jgi:VWFA-related protein